MPVEGLEHLRGGAQLNSCSLRAGSVRHLLATKILSQNLLGFSEQLHRSVASCSSADPPPLSSKVFSVVDIAAALGAVAQAMGLGEITLEEATSVAAVLDIRRKALETVEIEQRVAVLERRADFRR